MYRSCMAGIATVLVTASSTLASTVTIYPGNVDWMSNGNSGDGSSAITGTLARDGNGSLELRGDRTRFSMEVLGNLSEVVTYTFQWAVAGDSIAQLHANYTPALRLHVFDPVANAFSELVWEGAYNGVYGSPLNRDTWYSTSDSDRFWRWVTGSGVTFNGGAQVNQTIADWSSNNWYSDDAVVVGISVGVGSSAGSGYHAFADNITLGFADSEAVTYNFEVVPTPAAALPALGVMALLALRRRQPVA